jgi:hypothetical protein
MTHNRACLTRRVTHAEVIPLTTFSMAFEIHQRRLTNATWSMGLRDDIGLISVAECLPVLGIRDLRDR